MSLLKRRILFGFFVLLFCLLVPLVLIYATGNTINWRRFSLEKTASLLIKSEPSQATVSLNNQVAQDSLLGFWTKEQPITTEAKLTNLLPGEYLVRLDKEGYWPWEQRVNLRPEEAKNLGTIKLFKKAQPKLLSGTTDGQALASPSNGKIIVLTKNKLTIFNITDQATKEFAITLNKLPTEQISWSADETKISWANLIIDLNNQKIIDLSKDLKRDVSLIRWGNNSDIVYFANQQNIWRYTLSSKTLVQVNLDSETNNKKIIDYIINNDELYIIAKNNLNQEILLSGSLEGELKSTQLPSGDYHFILEDLVKPALTNTNHELYIIDEPIPLFSQPRLIKVTNDWRLVKSKDNSLIYTNTLELRRWDNENQEYLLNRFGSVINSFWPLNKLNGVIVATTDDLRVFVNSEQPFTINLANIKNPSALTGSSDDKTIYFFGTYNNQEGIYSLDL